MWNRTILCASAAIGLSVLGTQAQATTIIGAKFNHDLQVPSLCNPNRASDLCTWLLDEAQKNPGHETPDHDSTITQIQIEACGGGSFVLQVLQANVSVNPHQAKVISSGPLINYKGDQHNCTGTSNFTHESFNVHVPIKKGQFLGVVATKVNFVTQSGDSNAVFDPPLPDGGPLRASNNTGHGGGLLMMRAILTP